MSLNVNPNVTQIEEIKKIKPSPKARSWSRQLDLEIAETSAGFHRGPTQRRSPQQVIAWSFVAALIDGLVLTGGSLIAFVAYLSLTHLLISKPLFWSTLAVVLLSFAFIYMIIMRSFLGFSFGEWACGLRVGTLLQRLSPLYSVKVFLRVLLVFSTGLILLPTLSLVFGKDLAGLISRLPLTSPNK